MRYRSLNGDWEFSLLEENQIPDYRFKMPVPGNWKEQSPFEDYNGVGCYRYRLELREEELQKRLQLRFGGVMRKATVRFNGQVLAQRDEFQSPFRVDITDFAVEGENLVEVWVDNTRWDENLGNAPIVDITPLPIAGIYGQVTLELSEPVRICRIYTPADIGAGIAKFLLTVNNDTPETVTAELTLAVSDDSAEVYRNNWTVTVQPGERELSFDAPLVFRLWSPEDPALYQVEAALSIGDKTDVFSAKTGFKQFATKGREFYLNGQSYYLLGFGDDFVYPMGMPSAQDPGFYELGIRRAKEYGFNYVRHHSNMPFEAYLDAADRLGLLVQPELALANVPRERFNDENKQWFLRQWRSLIREYRHHPCIAVWCGGNEMEWGFPFDRELYELAKELDPYRPAASTDGNFMACDAGSSMDFVSICAAEYTDYLPWRELADMFLRDDSGKPQVVHEMGNYTTVPAIGDIPKYEQAQFLPNQLISFEKALRETGKEGLYEIIHPAANQLHKLCHKLNIEKARLSPLFCGYHVWTLTDYYDTTQGLLNAFYEDKAFTAEEFAAFNRQEVLLWDTERVTFRAGEEAELAFRLSRFGSDATVDGVLTLTLSDGQCRREERQFAGHGILEAARWAVTMPKVDSAKEYRLTACFEYGAETISNSWSLFVYPQVQIRQDKEIYINYLSRYLFAGEKIPVRHFTIPQPIGEDQLLVTEYVYDGMLDAVEQGANMLLLAKRDTFRHTVERNSFKSPWWSNGNIWYLNHTNNDQMCGIVEAHPATNMIPYDGGWKLDLFSAVEQAHAVDLDALGLPADMALYGVGSDLHCRAYLFEFRLGKGRILVSTLNHGREDMKAPEIAYLTKSLINYAMSEAFQPKTVVTKQQLMRSFQSM